MTSSSIGKAGILVVDDQELNLVAMREMLAELGQPIACAQSGTEALRLLLQQDFALILLDVRMPGMDGYETAALIRQRERTRNIPIIFLSAIDKDAGHQFRGYAAGAVDFVFKPFEPSILRAKVKVFIELHEKAEEIRRQAEAERRLLEENLKVRAQQLQTAEELRASMMQQSLVLGALPIALFATSSAAAFKQRRFIGGNIASLLDLDESETAALETDWSARVVEKDRDLSAELARELKETGRASIEYRVTGGDGKPRWLLDRLSKTEATGKDDEDAVGFILDISARKSMEEMLAHAQKLDAVGQMTSGIAHDFNNMLAVIIGSLDRALGDDSLSDKTRRRLDLSMQAAQSCADLTKRLLSFARRQTLDARIVSLNEEIVRLKPLISRALGGTIRLEIKTPECWQVRVDLSQLEAALLNLAVNARDAMPDGGDLTFVISNVTLDAHAAGAKSLEAGDYVEVCVSDTGAGMSEEVKRRAFEPFFTTKAPGKGTGLGLSSIFGFIRQSGGAMTIDSELGKGTAIRLLLPRSDRASGETAGHATKNALLQKDMTVLLVEDDEMLSQSTRDMLEGFGCRVLLAGNSREALEIEAKRADIDLLFSDIIMPGDLDGRALGAEMAKRRPGLPILLTSGNQFSGENLPNSAFLAKPYTQDQLKTALAALLDGPA